jgi:prepilin-type N-terminal cleavage/methylation domain-containing protein
VIGKQKGLTLIELLLVIVCLAVLSAVSLPYWISKGRPAYRLKNASLQVVSDIRLARIRAVAANCQYRLRFIPMSDSYLLERGDLPSGSSTWIVEGYERYFGTNGSTSFSGVQIAGEEQYSIVFRPTGTVTSSTVTLQNEVGRTVKIICSMAGRIRMTRE